MARLTFKYGTMKAGKSADLIINAFNLKEAKRNILVFKPAIDTKSPTIISRIGIEQEVHFHFTDEDDLYKYVTNLLDAGKIIDAIFVDEIQFATPLHAEELYKIAVKLDITVIAYGLRSDVFTMGFAGSDRMLQLAHGLIELKTPCNLCGESSYHNARRKPSTNKWDTLEDLRSGKVQQIVVDKDDKYPDESSEDVEDYEYFSLCSKCYDLMVGL